MTKTELIAFEAEVAQRFEAKEIRGPVHLSGGNEDQLIRIFEEVGADDWIFSTYRSHYHALLHGIEPERVMERIVAGRSMNLAFPERRFFTSAIVGGCLSIATGAAMGLKRQGSGERVWCFVGDMAASTGAFREATCFAAGHALPIAFVVEDNGLSCDSPTEACWGEEGLSFEYARRWYPYKRQWPHVGVGRYIAF